MSACMVVRKIVPQDLHPSLCGPSGGIASAIYAASSQAIRPLAVERNSVNPASAIGHMTFPDWSATAGSSLVPPYQLQPDVNARSSSPSSDPLAYTSPSGLYEAQSTGP